MTGWLLVLFFVIHAIIVYAVYRVFVRPRVAIENRGIFLAIALMSALVPLVGEVFGVLAYAIARRYASEKTLLDYDEYIHFDTQNLERLQQQAREDIDLVPLTDALKMDASKRKHSITQLMTTPLENTEEYLHLGLEHEDSETVHYAATVRNTLFDRYDVTLKQKIAQIDPERKETLYEVIETCESFMESGLLDDELRLQIQRQASMYLEQLGNLDSTDRVFLTSSARLAFRGGQADVGERMAEALIRQEPANVEGYIFLIEHHMTKGDWTKLRPILDLLRHHVAPSQVPEDYQSIIQQLEGARS